LGKDLKEYGEKSDKSQNYLLISKHAGFLLSSRLWGHKELLELLKLFNSVAKRHAKFTIKW
jgi:hypothetical protein